MNSLNTIIILICAYRCMFRPGMGCGTLVMIMLLSYYLLTTKLVAVELWYRWPLTQN